MLLLLQLLKIGLAIHNTIVIEINGRLQRTVNLIIILLVRFRAHYIIHFQIEEFSLLLMHQTLEVMAKGLFPLDNSLYYLVGHSIVMNHLLFINALLISNSIFR